MADTAPYPAPRTIHGPDLIHHILREVRRIGVREVSRLSHIPPSTISDKLREPAGMKLDEFFKITAAIGAGVQLVFVPPPPLELARRAVRYQRRSPAERELPSSTPTMPNNPDAQVAQEGQ